MFRPLVSFRHLVKPSRDNAETRLGPDGASLQVLSTPFAGNIQPSVWYKASNRGLPSFRDVMGVHEERAS